MKTLAVAISCLVVLLTFTLAAPLTDGVVDPTNPDIINNPDVTAVEYGKRSSQEIQYEHKGIKREGGEQTQAQPTTDGTAIEYGLTK